MKKILFTVLMLLSVMAMYAQNWTAPSGNEFPTSTPIYVQIKINGEVSYSPLEVAAFINGDCRAVSHEATMNTNDGPLHVLRVWGDPNKEIGKTISFKVFDHSLGLLFACTKQTTFTGETVSEVPFVLNLDKPTGVSITNPISITTKFPNKIDLSEYIKFTYEGMGVSGAPVPYEPLGESTIETALNYEWTAPTGGPLSTFTIDNNNILTATQSTLLPGSVENTGEEVMLSINVPENGSLCSGTTTIIIEEEITPVTGISCSMQTVKMNKGESLYDIEDLRNAIVIEPADASNKNYYFEPTNSEDADAFQKGIAMKGGTYKVNIISEYDPAIFTTIDVEVYAPVTSIRLSQTTIQAQLNDNIFELITPYINIFPEDATNKTYSFVPSSTDAIGEDGLAMLPGKYTVNVVSNDNPEIFATANVVITAIYAPEKIDVEINTNVYDALRQQITVVPENEEGESYTITPADEETANAIVNEYAIKNGEYTLVVTSVLNNDVSVKVKVYVTTPVDITFPSSLVISKYKDTEFELTMTGDNFDPNLVEFEIISTIEPVGFGVPTYTSADNGQGLVWNIRSTGTGSAELKVLYKGVYMPRGSEGTYICYIEAPAEISFNNNGWDWIYAPATISLQNNEGGYLEKLNIDENNKVIEIRSQTNLLYNDPVYGFLGDITGLSPSDGMYKIKAIYEDASNCVFASSKPSWDRNQSKTLQPGYTWIGYTNEWDMSLEELNYVMNNAPNEGDQIIGKTNFAEYSEGAWVGYNFILEAGKGYLYFNSSDAENVIYFDYIPDFSNQTYSLKSISAKKMPLSNNNTAWEYDVSQFADNMAIVAKVAELENPENYTIGAFVGDECRGMGRVVKDGKMMINVAGKSGEMVSFRLYNEYTGEYIDLDTKVNYSQKLGSLKSPISILGPSLTGITEITTDDNKEETYYDLNGRKVEGNISAGVYVVKTIKNGQVIVKKVVKK